MTAILLKYKIPLLVIFLLLFAVLLALFMLRQDTNNVPLRGVFV